MICAPNHPILQKIEVVLLALEMSKPPSKSVFVGNIPYGKLSCPETIIVAQSLTNSIGLSEEEITRIFSSAGQVKNFRLVYDRETGKPKGFGFVEFPDSGM